MNIIYFSNVTNNTHRFITKLENQNPEITTTRIPVKGETHPTTNTPYVLITPTYGTGKSKKEMIPHQVRKFLDNPTNRKNCYGVIASGNINFGEEYALAGQIISEKLNIPYLYRFELAGNDHDLQNIQTGLTEFFTHLNKQLTTQN